MAFVGGQATCLPHLRGGVRVLRVCDDFSLRGDPPEDHSQSLLQSSGIPREELSVFLHGAAVHQIV
jgi:hypothetical protein